jgi:hypothetical protein
MTALRLAHVHPAKLRLPAIKRRRADAMLTAQISCLRPGLVLFQYPNHLLFRVPALLHASSSRLECERTTFQLVEFSGGKSNETPLPQGPQVGEGRLIISSAQDTRWKA